MSDPWGESVCSSDPVAALETLDGLNFLVGVLLPACADAQPQRRGRRQVREALEELLDLAVGNGTFEHLVAVEAERTPGLPTRTIRNRIDARHSRARRALNAFLAGELENHSSRWHRFDLESAIRMAELLFRRGSA